MSHTRRKSIFGICGHVDSNQPAQLHRLARILKINSDLGSMSMHTIKTVNNEDPDQTADAETKLRLY